jgi:hypothetical protein
VTRASASDLTNSSSTGVETCGSVGGVVLRDGFLEAIGLKGIF